MISGTSPTTSKSLFNYSNQLQFYDQVVDFIQTLFFKHLLVNPKERKVVIVESVLCPTEVRDVFAKVLFRHFEISSILFVPSHLVALSTLAIDTALVVDIGQKEATIIPVYSGIQVLHSWQAQALAADAVHAEIKRQLIENGVSSDLLTNEVVEEIKIRTCFVTSYERSQKYKNKEEVTPPPDVKYPIQGKETITISGKLRETAYEVLFPEDNDRLGLPYIILDAIVDCTIDMRKTLLENLMIIGGTAMAQGLMSRLKAELLALLKSEVYKEKLHATIVKFHRVPAKENFAAWYMFIQYYTQKNRKFNPLIIVFLFQRLGGSIYGGTEMLKTKGLTKETYMKLNRVPDWTHLDDNRSWGN